MPEQYRRPHKLAPAAAAGGAELEDGPAVSVGWSGSGVPEAAVETTPAQAMARVSRVPRSDISGGAWSRRRTGVGAAVVVPEAVPGVCAGVGVATASAVVGAAAGAGVGTGAAVPEVGAGGAAPELMPEAAPDIACWSRGADSRCWESVLESVLRRFEPKWRRKES